MPTIAFPPTLYLPFVWTEHMLLQFMLTQVSGNRGNILHLECFTLFRTFSQTLCYLCFYLLLLLSVLRVGKLTQGLNNLPKIRKLTGCHEMYAHRFWFPTHCSFPGLSHAGLNSVRAIHADLSGLRALFHSPVLKLSPPWYFSFTDLPFPPQLVTEIPPSALKLKCLSWIPW